MLVRQQWILGHLKECPYLGVCYGAQLIAHQSGGNVLPSQMREYGRARLTTVDHHSELMKEISIDTQVWMSHADTIASVPSDFEIIASTSSVAVAAYKVKDKAVYGIQFHPEVTHTTEGKNLLRNFVVHICECAQDWTPDQFVDSTISSLKNKLGKDQVVMASIRWGRLHSRGCINSQSNRKKPSLHFCGQRIVAER